MKIRHFTASSLREALAQVKAALGEDAVILSTQTLDTGQVEVVAAVDEAEGERAPAPSSVTTSANTLANNTPEIQRMAAEMQQLRQLLEQQLAGLAWGQAQQQAPAQALLLKRLLHLGLGWELAQNLLKQLSAEVLASDTAWPALIARLSEKLAIEQQDILKNGGIVALVGPTGVGKTTTIAKLAGRFVMRHGSGQLALITTDCYKIGAQAQLQTFADLLGVPIHVAQTREELETLLIGLRQKKLILIDTAGMSQKDLRITQQLTAGYSGLVPIRNYLVLSAASPLNVMRSVHTAFAQMNLHALVLTKLDEAVQLGAAMTLMAETRLPLAYLSEGQRVPEDIQPADKDHLIDQAMVLANQQDMTSDQALKLGLGKEFFDAQ